MAERGYTFGANGYLAVVICAGPPEHAAAREVLATFKDAQLTKPNIDVVQDHPAGPDNNPWTWEELRDAIDTQFKNLTVRQRRILRVLARAAMGAVGRHDQPL